LRAADRVTRRAEVARFRGIVVTAGPDHEPVLDAFSISAQKIEWACLISHSHGNRHEETMTHPEEAVPELPPPLPPAPRPPRVWTVFVVYLLAVFVALFLQVIAVFVLALWLLATGTDASQLQTELVAQLTQPVPFLLTTLPVQLSIALAAIVPACLSPESFRRRLRLVKPALPAWGYLVVALGSAGPFAVGLALAYALTQVTPADKNVEMIYANMTWEAALPFLLFISLAPGFSEELLFRGYMQTRLEQRWPVWLAILVASALFALLHLMPQAVVFAFPLGLWFGLLAWRTGSVFPGMVCHAFVNGAWNVLQLGSRLGVLPEEPPLPVLVASGVLGVGCFLLSCWLLWRPAPLHAAENLDN
jgi:membrane protease YdiL (CAAX protease family)